MVGPRRPAARFAREGPLRLAALAVALAGCSLVYDGGDLHGSRAFHRDACVGDGRPHPLAFTQSQAIDLGDPAVRHVVVDDFDGDGRLDLAVAAPMLGKVLLVRGNGDGSFAPPSQIGAGDDPEALAADDLDGDGAQDLLVANGAADRFTMLGGDGAGHLRHLLDAPTGAGPGALATGDFDGDGRLDLAVADAPDGAVSVFAAAAGWATAATYAVVANERAVGLVAADLDRDGRDDLVVDDGAGFAVLSGAGAGLGAPVTHDGPDNVGDRAPRSIDLGDFNGDGALDVVVAENSAGGVALYLNDRGTFPSMPALYPGRVSAAVTLCDFNGDGALDVALPTPNEAGAVVLPGAGDGTLGDAVPVADGLAAGPNDIAVGDFNGDRVPDLVLLAGGDLLVLLHQP